MIRFFRRKDIPEPLSPDQADALLGKIMTDLELERPPRPGKKTYYHIVRSRSLYTASSGMFLPRYSRAGRSIPGFRGSILRLRLRADLFSAGFCDPCPGSNRGD